MFERVSFSRGSGIAAALLVALPVLASAASWRPRLGIEAGPSLGRMNSIALVEANEHWSRGGKAGVAARWDVGPGWALEAGPEWERLVSRESGTLRVSSGGSLVASADFEQTIRLDRIAMPVSAVFHPGGSRWSVEGGFSAAWLAHAGRTSDLSNETAVVTLPAKSRGGATPAAQIFEEVGNFDRDDWTEFFHR